MSAENELLGMYREWLRLARAQTRAIQTHNWSFHADCHRAVESFQREAVRLTRAAREEWARDGRDCSEKEKNFRGPVNELITIARQNQRLLDEAVQGGRERLVQLGDAGHNLKRLQRSYGFATSTARAA